MDCDSAFWRQENNKYSNKVYFRVNLFQTYFHPGSKRIISSCSLDRTLQFLYPLISIQTPRKIQQLIEPRLRRRQINRRCLNPMFQRKPMAWRRFMWTTASNGLTPASNPGRRRSRWISQMIRRCAPMVRWGFRRSGTFTFSWEVEYIIERYRGTQHHNPKLSTLTRNQTGCL